MAEKATPKPEKEGSAERAARIFRNLNAIGALALGGAAILAPPVAAGALGVWAGVNAVQAGGFEAARRWAKNKRHKT
jgi:hypothetical protein